MILTCPECATRYFVGDEAVGDTGRTVRCTNCGKSWRAMGEPPLDLRVSEDGAAGREAPAAVGELKATELPRAYRARVEETKRVREAAASGAVWAAIAAVFLLVVGAAIVFRTDVVRAVPRTASLYAALGMPVNQVGLTIERIQAQPGLQDGRAALMVTGVVRNVRSKSVISPPLQIALLDPAGKRVATKTARVTDPTVPPGGLRIFSVAMLDPPASAVDVEVTFSAAGKAAPAGRRKPDPAPEKLRLRPAAEAPAPELPAVPATPLAEDDPHGLDPGVPPADAPGTDAPR
jgi:predicted Zn finger-like uncharacterized protein